MGVSKPACNELTTGTLPQLPLDEAHWRSIFAAMRLSPRQAEIAALLMRGAAFKQIAGRLKITVFAPRERSKRASSTKSEQEIAVNFCYRSSRSHIASTVAAVVASEDTDLTTTRTATLPPPLPRLVRARFAQEELQPVAV